MECIQHEFHMVDMSRTFMNYEPQPFDCIDQAKEQLRGALRSALQEAWCLLDVMRGRGNQMLPGECKEVVQQWISSKWTPSSTFDFESFHVQIQLWNSWMMITNTKARLASKQL